MAKDHARLMASLPLIYQIHMLSVRAILGLWRFIPLVHAWSIRFQYIGRPYILSRHRD